MVELFISRGADINAIDKHGSTPLHVIAVCLKNSAKDRENADNGSDDGEEDEFHSTSALELSKKDWSFWPIRFSTPDIALAMDIIRSLVSNGGNIYAENSKGHTPLSLVKDTALQTDMMFLTRRSLLLFFEAVCITDDLRANCKSFRRVAENADLGSCIARFL